MTEDTLCDDVIILFVGVVITNITDIIGSMPIYCDTILNFSGIVYYHTSIPEENEIGPKSGLNLAKISRNGAISYLPRVVGCVNYFGRVGG